MNIDFLGADQTINNQSIFLGFSIMEIIYGNK